MSRTLRQSIRRRLRLWAWALGLAGPRPVLLHHDGELALHALAGRSDRLVLVFTSGRGRGRRADKLEFARVASDGGRNHVLFVTDLALSWYSRPGMRDRIVAAARALIADRGIREVRAIGVSMGGFGAMLFSRDLPVSHVAAFAPQIEMTPAAMAGRSWDGWREAVTPAVEPSLAGLMPVSPARYTLLYGDRDEDDLAQRARVPVAPNVSLLEAPGHGHDIATAMADRGLLAPVAAAMLDGAAPGAPAFGAAGIRAALRGGAVAAMLGLALPAAAAVAQGTVALPAVVEGD